MLVDDNTFNIFSLKLIVEEHFKVATEVAYSGHEALEIIKSRIENR